jgi:hypothetical protein
MTIFNGIAQRVEKLDHIAFVHHGILARMSFQQLGQALGKDFEVSINLRLVRLRHGVRLLCKPNHTLPESVKKPLKSLDVPIFIGFFEHAAASSQ